ncbi:MAG: hypothetical protein M1817_002552 [Caeruleum heppii]|nr:MAG: hypothetical protein M1817_002552 [Caeruleum heppii]
MGRIKKAAGPKHEATLSVALSEFIRSASDLSLPALPRHLRSLTPLWPLPRGDLYHWIPLLNRFDNILELFIHEYHLQDGPQTRPYQRSLLLSGDRPDTPVQVRHERELDQEGFGPEGDRELVEAILRFSLLLLENCGNRSLYSSSERLDKLLNTTSLSLLFHTLRLGVRCAQRYYVSRQRTVGSVQHPNPALLANHYAMDLDKVQRLAAPFVKSATPAATASITESPSHRASMRSSARLVSTSNVLLPPTDLVGIASNPPVESAAAGDSHQGLPLTKADADTWETWGNVMLSYYPTNVTQAAEGEKNANHKASGQQMSPSPGTPTPSRRASSLGSNQTPRRSRLATNTDSPSDTSRNTPPQSSEAAPDTRPGHARIVQIPFDQISAQSTCHILSSTPSDMPKDVRDELLHRLRVASALSQSANTRQLILGIRILAITNLAYVYPEPTLQQKMLQQDGEQPRRLQLTYQLAELVQPPNKGDAGIPRWLQTVALGCLEALAKHKSKTADVCAALSINVSHGILFYVVRKLVAELAEGQSSPSNPYEDEEWREALFSVLSHFATSPSRAGETLVSAGIVPILLQILTLRTSLAERHNVNVLNFLDSIIYHVRDAFQTLANAGGLEIISNLTAHTVTAGYDSAIANEGMPTWHRNQLADYEVPFFQQQTLRWLFKFMNHLMNHGGGNFDRLLRNLIDSPQLLQGLRLVLSNAKIFGSSVWTGAVNILNNFIHNEPTSYAVIAEAGLSKAFLEAVTQKDITVPETEMDNSEPSSGANDRDSSTVSRDARNASTPAVQGEEEASVRQKLKSSDRNLRLVPTPEGPQAPGILPSTDAIVTVPQAFGAICLNTAGLKLFLASTALESFFQVFVSAEHVKSISSDSDVAGILGNSFDELVRHHPALKQTVLDSVLVMVVQLGQLCRSRARDGGAGAKLLLRDDQDRVVVAGGRKALSGKQEARSEPTMADSDSPSAVIPNGTAQPEHASEPVTFDEVKSADDDGPSPSVSTYIDVAARFLTGFFSNHVLCNAFIEKGGAEWVLDLATLPSLPYDFHNKPASLSLSRAVHMLVEQKPHLVLPSLIRRAQAATDDVNAFHDHVDRQAFFSPLVAGDRAATDDDNAEEGRGKSQMRENVRANGTAFAKSLVTVHTLCCILSESFAQPSYTHRSGQSIFTQVNLADMYIELVAKLGAVRRACVWEEILLQKSIPERWKAMPPSHTSESQAVDANATPAPQTTTVEPSTTVSQSHSAPAEGASQQGTMTSTPDDEVAQQRNAMTLRYLLSKIPAAVTSFFQGLGKLLVAKRQHDGYQKQLAVTVAEAIATTTIEQLRSPSLDDIAPAPDRYAYWIVMLTSLSQLMIEAPTERPQPQCLTLVLQAFKNHGGFDVIKNILDTFCGEVRTLHRSEEQQQSPPDAAARSASSYAGIRIVVNFYYNLVVSRNIVEANQTTAMASRDRDRDKPDYFSPNQFVVELRTAVLPVVRDLWDSDFLDKASSSIVKSVIDIIRTCLDADTEAGAFRRADNPPRRLQGPIKTWKESIEQSDRLVRQGYERELVREALYRCNNNPTFTEEYCKAVNTHERLARLPVPAKETSRRSSRPQIRPPTSPSQTEQPDSASEATPSQPSLLPPVTADGQSVLLETTPMDVEDDGMTATPAGVLPSAAAASTEPNNVDASENDGLLAMSIDNLLGNLTTLGVPPSPTPEQAMDTSNNGEQNAPTSSPGPEQTADATRLPAPITVDDLDEIRVAIRGSLIDRSLDILNVHSDVTFELADLITTAVTKAASPEPMRVEIGETLVQSLLSLQLEEDSRPAGKKIAAYAHLLGLILQDRTFYDATRGELKENFSALLAFIKTVPDQPPEDAAPWIGQILLVLETLLAEDAQPRQIRWTPPSSTAPESTLNMDAGSETEDAVVLPEQKTQLFDAIIEILPRVGKDLNLALSVARALVMLTRDRQLAIRLGQRRNLQRLFVMVKQLAGLMTDRLQGTIMSVLRHVIEDEETLRQIMRSEIKGFFDTRQSARQVDTNGYVRSLSHLVLRNPELFLDVSNDLVKLVRFDESQRHQTLALKVIDTSDSANIAEGSSSATRAAGTSVAENSTDIKASSEAGDHPKVEKQKANASDLKAPVVENPDGVIHYLLCELLSYKDVDDKEPPKPPTEAARDKSESVSTDVEMVNGGLRPSSSAPPANSTSEVAKPEKTEFKAEQHPIYIYRCFVMQCLTELLSSYKRTKVEFINFSRKAPPQVMTPTKPRSGVLNYLLNEVIPLGTLTHADGIAFRKRCATSSWAMATIAGLCSKTGELGPEHRTETNSDEGDPDLLFVRKFVLEHMLKAYKDAVASTEGLDSKYARLLSLADLFNRILTGRTNSNPHNASAELVFGSQKQLAKIMYEKNFIAVLTSSIAEIDLNFPSAKRAVKYILRPLKLLTQTAIDLSESSSISTTPGQTDEDEISSATSVSEMGDEREETPDLFRNSTLGMFDPGRGEESSSASSEDDEDMYDDDEYGDEMEYDEEMAGEDEEDVISDEDEELGQVEGLSGDVGLDVEVVLDGDEDDEDANEDDGDDEDDSDDMDEDDEIEVMDEIGVEDGEDLEGDFNAAEGGDDAWQSEDDGDEGYEFGAAAENGEGDAHEHHHDSPLEHIVRALNRDEGDMLQHLEEGDLQMDLDPEAYNGEDFQDDEEAEDDEEDLEEDEPMYEHDYASDGILKARSLYREAITLSITVEVPTAGILYQGITSQAFPSHRSHRPMGVRSRGNDDGTNPLLQRDSRGGATPGGGRSGRTEPMTDWITAIESGHGGRGLLHSEGPVSIINNLLSVIGQGGPGLGGLHHHGGALHLQIGGGPPRGMPRELQAMLGIRRPVPDISRAPRDDPMQAVDFHPSSTTTRWQEEARLLFGQDAADKTHRIVNALLSRLVPPAIAAEKLRHEKSLVEARLAREKKDKDDEEARVAKEEAEKLEKEKREAEEQREATVAGAAPAAAEVQPIEDIANDTPAETAAEEAPEVERTSDGSAMEGVEATEVVPPGEGAGGPSSQEPATRVRTTIRGRELDITELDIDPDYLDALPEELREEVLLHQIAERRSQAASTGEQPTDISREFLEALPDDIRAELLEQEAQDRRRREREDARRRTAAAAGATTQPIAEEMDAATVLATLEPGLRQAILMEQDEDMLAQLPQDLAAEARALGGEHRLRHHFIDPTRAARARGVDFGDRQLDRSSKKPQRRSIVQMLDKAGVATLLRLMFMPQQGSARHTLNDLLRNICENRQNRNEVVNLLLSILQDGSADTNAVERSFAQLSLRARQPASQKAPLTPKRTMADSALPSDTEMSPLMVVQQCLGTLVLLVNYNPHVRSYFLTEHDTIIGLKRGLNRKGKGKESRESRYALNALLGLLDRKLIMESSTVMEQLSSLLNSITQPLPLLLKKDKDSDKPEKAQGPSTADAPGEAVMTAPRTAVDAPDRVSAPAADQGSTVADISESTVQDVPGIRPTSTLPSVSAATEIADHEAPADSVKTKKPRTMTPPVIPEHNLRMVVTILAARECSSKTFRDTVSTINNLSSIPGAKEIFGKELLRQAEDLGRLILADLNDLTSQISHADAGVDVQAMALVKFSPASSDQAKLLRVLTALDYLFDTLKNGRKDQPSTTDSKDAKPAATEQSDILTDLYENATFGPLWAKLSECLSTMRERENMLNVATILLPLIEALMVVCKNTTLKNMPINRASAKEMAISSPAPETSSESLESLFFNFTEEHRKILNDLVRSNPKLMSGTFSLLVKNPKVLEFDNKRNYFTRRLHSRGTETRHTQPPLQLSVRRDQVFLDSFKSLYFKGGDEVKYGKLSIRFHGEEGVDAGGVTREWFQALSRQMFDPNYALFTPVASDRTTFHPNRLSAINEEHFNFFKFVGRIIGKALYEGRVLDCHFSRAVYKRILGRLVSVKDMETLDLEYYKSLKWMLENDITDIITETFSVETERFGETQTVDLKEDGRNISVTEDNKHEYVRLVVEYRLTGSVREQLDCFLKGFHDIVPAELIAIFNEQELELLISGLPDIDVDDWKNNTEYQNYSASSPQIQWFWRAVRSFDKEERAKLLQFVTGTSKVPLNGFKELEGMNGVSRFNIHRDYGSKDRLPSSHTCFNQLDLPEYDSYESLRHQVYLAMTAGSEYFGFA